LIDNSTFNGVFNYTTYFVANETDPLGWGFQFYNVSLIKPGWGIFRVVYGNL